VSRKVAEDMNQMMLAVVTNGTAQKATLDFTTVVGKTGTSSSYRDAWFVGFTGALVTGVWVGYDDFRPMSGITGGSLPTQAWHSYMVVALKNYRTIPPIPGLGMHPSQVADQQRLNDLKRTDPAMAQAQVAQATQKTSSLMPDPTRVALRKVAESMRQAAGIQPTPASATPASAAPASVAPAAPIPPKGKPPEPKAKSPATAPERRADVPGPGTRP
jgi:penicillin-binding protein 1A